MGTYEYRAPKETMRERDYQATLPQGRRTAAEGCKPRHGRDDRKRERSFISGLSLTILSSPLANSSLFAAPYDFLRYSTSWQQ